MMPAPVPVPIPGDAAIASPPPSLESLKYMCAPVDLEGSLRTFWASCKVSFRRFAERAKRVRSVDGGVSKAGVFIFLGLGPALTRRNQKAHAKREDALDAIDVRDLETVDAARFIEAIGPNLSEIKNKVLYVLVPGNGHLMGTIADDPDRWGALLCVLAHCFVYYFFGIDPKVSWVFFVWAFGSSIVSAILNLLGRSISFETVVCVLGYSTVPLTLCLPILGIVRFSAFHTLVRACGCVLSAVSSGSSLVTPQLENKRILIVFPVMMYYVFLLSL